MYFSFKQDYLVLTKNILNDWDVALLPPGFTINKEYNNMNPP